MRVHKKMKQIRCRMQNYLIRIYHEHTRIIRYVIRLVLFYAKYVRTYRLISVQNIMYKNINPIYRKIYVIIIAIISIK